MKYLFLIFSVFILSACESSRTFSQTDLQPMMYKGYWSMTPVNNIYRVIKFYPTGIVKIYDYDCEQASYDLNEIETIYLAKKKQNEFILMDEKKKPFAYFNITQENSNQFKAQEQFIDPKIEPRIWHLNYTHNTGLKPICSPNY